jgi:Protein of unknown function (DUF4012)
VPTVPPPAPTSAPPDGDDAVELRRVRVRVRRRAPLHRRLVRRPLLVIVAVPVVLAIAAAIDLAVTYVPALQALREGRAAAQQASDLLRGAGSHLDVATLDQATSLLRQAESDFGERSAVLDDGALGGLAAHLPFAGDQVQAVRALRHAGQAAVAVGLDLAPIARQLLAPAPGPSGDTALARVTAVAQSDAAQFARLRGDLDALDSATVAIGNGRLLGPLSEARDAITRQGHEIGAALRPALALAGALPGAIGSGSHTYLLLLTNPAEERPGGGFIGAVGELTFSDGRLVASQFRSSDFANGIVHSLPAPRALDQYLFHGAPWQLSDAGWSPDFPTSAAQVLAFYRLATGVQPAGVIAVDPDALAGVLRVLGPVSVPNYPQQVTAADTLLQLNRIVNEPGQPGKAFLPPFGAAMVRALLGTNVSQFASVAQTLGAAVAGKHVLVDVADSALQRLVDNADAAGRVQADTGGDSLLVDDANLSAGKEDLFVQRSFALDARVSTDGTVHDHLTLTYTNSAPQNDIDRPLVESGGGAYRDYLRILVPADAVVDGITVSQGGAPAAPLSPDSIEMLSGRKAIGVFVVVPRGATIALALDEHSHLDSAGRYRLAWEKQNNAMDWPVKVSVTGASGRVQEWRGLLDRDRTWEMGV